MNSMGLRVEKLEEDYISDPSDDDDEDVFSDQLNYKHESMAKSMNRKSKTQRNGTNLPAVKKNTDLAQ